MTDLFAEAPTPPPARRGDERRRPLADRLRPARLADVAGQGALLHADGPLTRMLARGRLASMILWGPPGSGKTTLARLIAAEVGAFLLPLSAVMAGVADLRKAFDEARRLARSGRTPVLFIDEIHRFNRAQQDGLLHEVEDGTVTLVGATTENPSFSLNAALVSRCQVLVLERLDRAALDAIRARAEAEIGRALPLTSEAAARLADLADGDGRYFLNLVETLADLPAEPRLDVEGLSAVLRRRMPLYDKGQDGHYNLISALHKSVRGSDPDAALYWFARMVKGGEDPRYLARRLIRMASEDIGLAAATALPTAVAAAEAYERLGSPEGELALAHCVLHLATAPKSNAAYTAFKAATAAAEEGGSLMPPSHILNAPTRLMKQLGYGEGYAYDHDAPDAFSGRNYLPDGMERRDFYRPAGRGDEAAIKERLDDWARRRDAPADAARHEDGA